MANSEVEKILFELSQGTITREQAKRAILGLEKCPKRNRMIRVAIKDRNGKNINLKVPFSMVETIYPWIKFEVSGVNVREVLEEAILDENFVGEVVNIEGDFGETCTVRIV
ncbi:MAG TPA: hypothetical protein PKN77_04520 [Caldisericia bacterium]|nr:hypothetical protein [Caldisericia bacterium]